MGHRQDEIRNRSTPPPLGNVPHFSPSSWHKLFLLAPVGRNGSEDRGGGGLSRSSALPSLSRLLGNRIIPRYGGWTAR
ncbi:hypothetical protein CGRA01v4_03644 [Colletotrichum graminicola]|nr:hypothetical protein CGRA01v4_03644 [Colletotrichum graminicola]